MRFNRSPVAKTWWSEGEKNGPTPRVSAAMIKGQICTTLIWTSEGFGPTGRAEASSQRVDSELRPEQLSELNTSQDGHYTWKEMLTSFANLIWSAMNRSLSLIVWGWSDDAKPQEVTLKLSGGIKTNRGRERVTWVHMFCGDQSLDYQRWLWEGGRKGLKHPELEVRRCLDRKMHRESLTAAS